MTTIGFPSAHHEEVIELSGVDARKVVETALGELGWALSENADGEIHQPFRPDWWKNHWKTGIIKVLSDRVTIRVEKYALLDVVDWNDGCAKLVEQFRAKVMEVAARSSGYRT